MTKKEARAVLRCQRQIQDAISSCLEQLGEQERTQADAYWALTIRGMTEGRFWGSMPVRKAAEVLHAEV